MADKSNKHPDNAPGKYYVDSQCIDCDLCRQIAPANFERNEANGYTYVKKQPQTPEETTLCEQAKTDCPVEAIGNDGA